MALVRRFGRDRRPTATAATATGTTSTATATDALAAVYDPSVVVQDTNPFIHVAFSGDGCDLVATTRTKLLRFPLSGAAAAEGLAWSALLPARCSLVTTHLPALTANTASTSTSAFEQQQQEQQQWSVLCAPEHTTAATTAAAVTTAAGTAVDGASLGELLLLGARCGGAAGPAAVALSAAQTVSGHNRAVTAAAFSHDGHWAVTGDCSGVVAVRRRLQRAVAPPAPAAAGSAAATAAGDGSHWEERYTVSSTPSAATTVTDAADTAAAAYTAASTAAATRSASETEGNGESPARATPFAPRQQAWTPVSQQQQQQSQQQLQQQQQQQQQPSLASVELGLLGGAAPVALHAAMAAVSARTPAH
jgi:trimeric autotransporter adhesin